MWVIACFYLLFFFIFFQVPLGLDKVNVRKRVACCQQCEDAVRNTKSWFQTKLPLNQTHTYLQIGTLFGQVKDLPGGIQIGPDTCLQFLIKPQGGSTVEDNVHIGDEELFAFWTQTQVLCFDVRRDHLDFGPKIWDFFGEAVENLRGKTYRSLQVIPTYAGNRFFWVYGKKFLG